MSMTRKEAGELIYRLKADLTDLEEGLGVATDALEDAEKKGGGLLTSLTNKWMIMSGAALGAAYAIIKASPSLQFGMEEIGYRFRYMAGIIGEEFAPLIYEVLLPEIDKMIPAVEQIAPKIGQAVDSIVGFLAREDVGEWFDYMKESTIRAAIALSRIFGPALQGVWTIIQKVGPYVATGLALAFRGLALALEYAANLFEKAMAKFGPAIEWIWDKLVKFKEIVIDPLVAAFRALYNFLNQAPTPVERPWEEESRIIQQLAHMTGSGGFMTEGGLSPPGIYDVETPYDSGGYVFRTGPAMLHAGDVVLGPQTVGTGTRVQRIEVKLNNITIRTDQDIRTVARKIGREIKYEQERSYV